MAEGQRKLAVIAGAGALPKLVIEGARRQGLPVTVVAFHGHTDAETVSGIDHFWAGLGSIGGIVKRLKAAGVTDLVMAGAIRRPRLLELRPDWYTTRFFMRLGTRALGDDGLLRAIVSQVESEGFRVIGTADLVERVFAPLGPVGSLKPDQVHTADIAHGMEVGQALGALDIGQAVIVQQGVVLGLEAVEGTDALIERVAKLARPGSRPVLVKLSKPQQDVRVDLPTIGLTTLRNSAQAGFAGLAVEANRTILLDADRIGAEADKLGLFIVGFDAPSR
jgi:DUF1009 family protein